MNNDRFYPCENKTDPVRTAILGAILPINIQMKSIKDFF